MKNIRIILVVSTLFLALNGFPTKGIEVAKDTVVARAAFVDMPLKTLDILRRSTKLDMLDYYDVDSIWQAPNGMGGLSELVTVTPSFLEVKITPVTSMQISILPQKKEDIIMVLYTIGGEGQSADTDVQFYDSAFQELTREKYLPIPKVKEFFNIKDKEELESVLDVIPFPTIEYIAEPGTTDLKARLTVGEYMSKENYDLIKKHLIPAITYHWTGSRYELAKTGGK